MLDIVWVFNLPDIGNVISSDYVMGIIYGLRLKDFMEKLEELKDPRIIYVSDLVSCSHKRLFRIKFPELQFRFEPPMVLGELVHRGLEDMLKERGFEQEVSIEKKVEINGETYIVKGRMDAFNRDDGVVIEIKTARSSQGVPHRHHILQIQIYMNIVDAREGLLVYITPDRILEYKVVKETIDIDELVRETINDVVHPRWDWECRYCVYSRMCPYRITE